MLVPGPNHYPKDKRPSRVLSLKPEVLKEPALGKSASKEQRLMGFSLGRVEKKVSPSTGKKKGKTVEAAQEGSVGVKREMRELLERSRIISDEPKRRIVQCLLPKRQGRSPSLL